MCGIAGWVAAHRSAPDDRLLQPMLDALVHRGPDGCGTFAFNAPRAGVRGVLGHRRLAIIDPEGSRQPMRDVDAGIALTFNGEIYNFRELRAELEAYGYAFERDSDTEVLLRAYQHWDTGVCEHLRGQFAFAVWDASKERLYLARDRFGEKPLYLVEAGETLFFASEIKALLAGPLAQPEIDLQAVWDYLAYRYVPGPRTLFRGIRKLAPASWATWQAGRLRETRYWVPPDRAPLEAPLELAPAETVARFLEALEEAVELQMVSDVPFGAFLSGGLDSSMIVALMSRHTSRVKTFSVGFTDARYSELAHAAAVARQFGTEHHEIVVSPDEIMNYLPRLVAQRDAPVSEPSDIPVYMLACAARRSVKMVLTGEGSDEILGGYPPFRRDMLLHDNRGDPETLRVWSPRRPGRSRNSAGNRNSPGSNKSSPPPGPGIKGIHKVTRTEESRGAPVFPRGNQRDAAPLEFRLKRARPGFILAANWLGPVRGTNARLRTEDDRPTTLT